MSGVTLTQLLQAVVEQGASDLHLNSGAPPALRVDGHIVPLKLPPLSPQDAQQLCASILTPQQQKDLERNREVDVGFSVQNLGRFRANIHFQRNTVAGAFRLIPFGIPSIADLGLPTLLGEIVDQPRGLIVVTGPTGSGKSTTLAAALRHINETHFKHIVTIEDPIEFVHTNRNCLIEQRELGRDTLSFAGALRSVLRQDPDVILVGELRDLETISAALTAAETGHLVLSTVHTNSSVATLTRLVDAYPAHQQAQIRTQLAFSLCAVISQSLIPSSKGGRVLAMEILLPNTGIRSLIREGKIEQIYSMMQTGQDKSGMQTMNQSLMDLVARDLITVEDALQMSHSREELVSLLARAQGSPGKRPKAS